MKKLFLVKLFLAVLFIALYTPIAMAANIKIKGAVKDKLSKEPLIGATIRLVGTQAGAVTDLDGNFELNGVGVLEGMYDIEVKYVGYKTEVRRKVRVENGNLVILNLELETDAQELADVVVVAKKNRENENMLLLEQQKAVIAVQAVGVKELSRKGVSDAEGAVSKVAGVSKQEGVKNVFVRGLGDRYNATTFNGFPIPSEDPEYKNISLDFFSTDIIQTVGVNKAFNAEAGPLIAVCMGVITGVGGGIIRDVLAREIPMILRTEIYATACIIGGIVHATAYYTFSVPLETASMMGMVVTLLIRLAAIRWHLKLPTFALDENGR